MVWLTLFSPHLHPDAPTLQFGVGRLNQQCSSAKTLFSWEPGHCVIRLTHACGVPLALMQPTYCSKLIAAAMIAMINVFILSHLLSVSECTDNYLLLIPPLCQTLGWTTLLTKSCAFQRKEKAKYLDFNAIVVIQFLCLFKVSYSLMFG